MGRITFAPRGFTPRATPAASRKLTAAARGGARASGSGKTKSGTPSVKPRTKRSLRADLDGLGTLSPSLIPSSFHKRRTPAPVIGRKGRTKMAVAALNRREEEKKHVEEEKAEIEAENEWEGIESEPEEDTEDQVRGKEEHHCWPAWRSPSPEMELPPTNQPESFSVKPPSRSPSPSSRLDSDPTAGTDPPTLHPLPKYKKQVHFAPSVTFDDRSSPKPLLSAPSSRVKRISGTPIATRKRRKLDSTSQMELKMFAGGLGREKPKQHQWLGAGKTLR